MREKLQEAIKEFNQKFDAKCKLVEVKDKSFKVLFKGHICFTCGAFDYFEDLRETIEKKIEKEVYIDSYEQMDDGSYLVTYSLEKTQTKREILTIFYDYSEVLI